MLLNYSMLFFLTPLGSGNLDEVSFFYSFSYYTAVTRIFNKYCDSFSIGINQQMKILVSKDDVFHL